MNFFFKILQVGFWYSWAVVLSFYRELKEEKAKSSKEKRRTIGLNSNGKQWKHAV